MIKEIIKACWDDFIPAYVDFLGSVEDFQILK